MTEQQKATTADAEALVCREALQFILDLDEYTSPDDQPDLLMCTTEQFEAAIARGFDRLRATPQLADVSQARPAQEDAPVADGTNWREVASRLYAALLSNDASHAEQARRIYVRALLAATDKAIARSLGAHLT